MAQDPGARGNASAHRESLAGSWYADLWPLECGCRAEARKRGKYGGRSTGKRRQALARSMRLPGNASFQARLARGQPMASAQPGRPQATWRCAFPARREVPRKSRRARRSRRPLASRPPLGTRRRSATRCAVRCGPTHGLAFGFLQGRRAWKPALPQLARRQPFLAPPPRGCDWQADRGQGTEDRGQGIGMHHSKFTIQNLAARSPLLTGVPGKNRTTARRSFLTASPDPWEPAPRPKSNPEKSHEHR